MLGHKDILLALGLTPEQIEKVDAGDFKTQEIVGQIQDYVFTLIKSDKTKIDSLVNPVLEERERKYVQKVRNQLGLRDEDVLNRDLVEILELGLKKKKEEMLAEYQNTNDAQLVEKNNKLKEELDALRVKLEDYTTNTVPRLQAEFEAKVREKDIEFKLRDWLKENFQFSVNPHVAELTFHKHLRDNGYIVDLDSNGSKLILLSKETRTAPLIDPSEGTGVLLIDTFAKKVFNSERLLRQSNADTKDEMTADRMRTTGFNPSQSVQLNGTTKLLGLEKIKQSQEKDKLFRQALA